MPWPEAAFMLAFEAFRQIFDGTTDSIEAVDDGDERPPVISCAFGSRWEGEREMFADPVLKPCSARF